MLLFLLGVAVMGFGVGLPVIAIAAEYEVWVIDQVDTTPDGGGTLYIYQGRALTGGAAASAVPEMIDLGGTAQRFCVEKSGSVPRRPHMISFNHTHSHAIVSYVTSGHVLFMVAATRTPVACFDVGAEAHAAFPSPDQSHVVVANQNGKLLQRIRTHYATNAFSLEPAATLDLAQCRHRAARHARTPSCGRTMPPSVPSSTPRAASPSSRCAAGPPGRRQYDHTDVDPGGVRPGDSASEWLRGRRSGGEDVHPCRRR